MSGTESQVGVNTGGLAKVRTLEVTTFVGGVETVVEMQVVSIADENGNPLPLRARADQLEILVRESKRQTAILLELCNRLVGPGGVSETTFTLNDVDDYITEQGED